MGTVANRNMVALELASVPYDSFFLFTDLIVVVTVLIPHSSKTVAGGSLCYAIYLACDVAFHVTGDQYPLAVMLAGGPFFYAVLAHLVNIYKSGNNLLFLVGLLSVLIPSVGVMQLWRGLDGVVGFFFCGSYETVDWNTTPFSQSCGATPLYWEMHALAHCLLFLTGIIDIQQNKHRLAAKAKSV